MAGSGAIYQKPPGRSDNFERFTIDTNNMSVPAGSTATYTVILVETGFVRGDCMFYNDPSIADVTLQRLPVDAWFGQALNDCAADSGVEASAAHFQKGFAFEEDARLSNYFFSADNDPGTSIRLISIQLVSNGSSIEFVFQNQDGGSAHDVDMVGRGIVERG